MAAQIRPENGPERFVEWSITRPHSAWLCGNLVGCSITGLAIKAENWRDRRPEVAMHSLIATFSCLRNTESYFRNNNRWLKIISAFLAESWKHLPLPAGVSIPIDGRGLAVRNWAASILARGRCTSTASNSSSSSSSQVHSRIRSSPVIQSSELRAVCPLAQSDFPRLVQAIALARPGALHLATVWVLATQTDRPWRHISARTPSCVCENSCSQTLKNIHCQT